MRPDRLNPSLILGAAITCFAVVVILLWPLDDRTSVVLWATAPAAFVAGWALDRVTRPKMVPIEVKKPFDAWQVAGWVAMVCALGLASYLRHRN